jgi:hypothetical protein
VPPTTHRVKNWRELLSSWLPKEAAVLLYLFARESSTFINEAELVAEWVGAIEAAFSPRLCFNRAQHAGPRLTAHSPKVLFKVVNSEVDMVWILLGVPRVAVCPRIKASENALTAAEVMPPGGDPVARLAEHGRVESGRFINTGNGNDYAK